MVAAIREVRAAPASASQQPALEGAHRGLLGGLGVVPAADVERAVGHEEAELVGRDQRTSPVWPPRPAAACSAARSTDTTMSPRCSRRRAASANAAAAPGCRGGRRGRRERRRRQQRERQDVGRAVVADVRRVQLGQLGVVGEDEPDRGRRRRAGGVESRGDRPGQARRRGSRGSTPSRIVTSIRHGER